ncbi:hypothetical protein BXY47_0102 [Dietzia kunjamensis]|uniref:hypothetical protein n=1 Tax=Dietzia kunjamensis TaxID=322509 RepID=UPI000E70D9F7|nr:hypothetical protein [Dietzia kunjamensis]MBB1012330.1 hypothetical protein [Dietzia kunjamensis]RKE68996.1 hypothetical protein BXY47_0102 [Dietzia kunjamensis]
MGVSAEWGRASDTTVEAAQRGAHPFSSADPVEAAAPVFDPNSGGGLVVEGGARELAAMLAAARAALAPTLAADALKNWRRYHEVHTALAASDAYAADQHEDNELPGVAAALAEALAALLD